MHFIDPPQPQTHDQTLTDERFGDLYISTLPSLKAFLGRLGCDSRHRDDLAQETFLRAWNRRKTFSGTARFRTWLFGIARNALREHSRRQRCNPRTLDLQLPDPISNLTSEAETSAALKDALKDAVRAAVNRLPPKQRQAVSLVYLHGVAQSDAAIQSQCACAAFRRRLASGRTRLRSLLDLHIAS